MAEKIKAIQPEIIVKGTIEKPYYEILYYDTSDKIWHIRYGSYNLENVVKWRQEYIEVVKEIADVVEVVRCKDCIFFNAPKEFKLTDFCRLHYQIVKPDDFCSYGEGK